MKIGALILATAFATTFTWAQNAVQPVAGPPQPTRFQQLELTYLDNLKRVHAPLLQQYLGELKALLEKSPPADAPAIKTEAARVQKMIGDGGLIEFTSNKPAPSAAPGPAGNGIVFTLEPHETQPPQSDDKPVPLGTAAWTLSKLPAGNYDVIAHYSCQKLADNSSVKVSFHDQNLSHEVKPNNVTKSDAIFRVMRLGQLKLKDDATFEKFTVTASPGGEPWFFVKQILIVKSKDKDSN